MRRSIQAIVTSALVLLLSSRVGSAEQAQLAVDGRARTYLLERPPTQGPRPTIIMLHGFTGSAAQIAQQTGLAEPAKQAGFVAVFPEGLSGRWNLLPPSKQTARYVQLFPSAGGVPDDVAFLKALIGDLNRRNISDPKRIYLAGRSLGGAMALRMTCLDAPMFAAVALLISAMPEETGEDCRPAQPLPALMLNVTGAHGAICRGQDRRSRIAEWHHQCLAGGAPAWVPSDPQWLQRVTGTRRVANPEPANAEARRAALDSLLRRPSYFSPRRCRQAHRPTIAECRPVAHRILPRQVAIGGGLRCAFSLGGSALAGRRFRPRRHRFPAARPPAPPRRRKVRLGQRTNRRSPGLSYRR
jgi:dienelactone hydrolase